MAVLLTLATADLCDTQVVLGEEGYFGWVFDICFALSCASLLPSIIAPGKKSTVTGDAHCEVHTEIDLLDRTWNLSYESWHGNVSCVGAQLVAAKGVKVALAVSDE